MIRAHEILQMAEESEMTQYVAANNKFLVRFAQLIAARCAELCEENADTYEHSYTPARAQLCRAASLHCASLIRRSYVDHS